MINHIQINNFMTNRRRIIRRNEVMDINQVIVDMSDNNYLINRKSPEPYDDINYNLLYNENTESEGEKKEFELSPLLNEDKICRICYEGEKYNDELIHPCLCKGTQKYIHLKCLQKWRFVNRDEPEKRDNCEICKYHYAIKERIDYLKYTIYNDIVSNLLYFVLLIGVSTMLWIADYYLDFFIIKILTFFQYENSIIYIRFKKTQDVQNTLYDPSIDIYVYSFFIINITIFLLSYIHQYSYRKYFNKLNKIRYYKNKIRKYKYTHNILRFSIFPITYLSVLSNDFYLLANLVPIMFVINLFFHVFYIEKHNKLTKNVNMRTINNEYIYSFEENPLILHLREL